MTYICHRYKQLGYGSFEHTSEIHLVWDRSPIHRGPEVNALLAAHPRLKIIVLPAYAPELNPVEFIWSYLKYSRLANLALPDLKALQKYLNKELRLLHHNQVMPKQLCKGTGLTGLDRMLLC